MKMSFCDCGWEEDTPHHCPLKQTPEVMTEGKPSIKVVKNTKGYNWEIKIYSEDIDYMLKAIESTDKSLRELYGEDKVNEWSLKNG